MGLNSTRLFGGIAPLDRYCVWPNAQLNGAGFTDDIGDAKCTVKRCTGNFQLR